MKKDTVLKIQKNCCTYSIEIKYNFGFAVINWFLAHVLTLRISGWRNILMKAQTAMRAMKITSIVPTLVLVAVPLPRFAMPSLILLVVEVMAVSSRPVCSLSTADREVRSPDNTAVFTWRQGCRKLEENDP